MFPAALIQFILLPNGGRCWLPLVGITCITSLKVEWFPPFPRTKGNTLPHLVHAYTHKHSLSFERLTNEALPFRWHVSREMFPLEKSPRYHCNLWTLCLCWCWRRDFTSQWLAFGRARPFCYLEIHWPSVEKRLQRWTTFIFHPGLHETDCDKEVDFACSRDLLSLATQDTWFTSVTGTIPHAFKTEKGE